MRFDALHVIRREAIAVGGFDLILRAAAADFREQKLHGGPTGATRPVLVDALRETHRLIRTGREQVRDAFRPVGALARRQRRGVDALDFYGLFGLGLARVAAAFAGANGMSSVGC